MAAKKVPLGTQIDALWQLRENKRALEADVEILKGRIAKLEETIIKALDKEKTGTSSGSRAGVSITENVVPIVKDWEKFMKEVVVKQGLTHLVERRPSVTGCREIWEQGGNLPGLETFVKRKLNLRTIND